MPSRITLLDEVTASRIAAGEVVERPASVVKELVENSIDAGATSVTVHIDEGGKRRIEVVDDGHGMDPEDAVLAVQRHATSKIRSADDLSAISTLGFRGEALPSIASVSHFTLITKSAESAVGCRLEMHGGTLGDVNEIGCRDGTVVRVEDLFYNTPARLKFMKTTGTELGRCVEAVSLLAAAYPGVSFGVVHNGLEVLSTPGNGDLANALARVWGRDAARSLVGVALEDFNLTLGGVVGTPDVSRPGRTHQFFIVNGRPIRSRVLGHALEHAFREVTPEARYPIACLRLDVDPTAVDVNVHPTKMEVKFTYERELHAAVVRAVTEALRRHGILPELRGGTSVTAPAGQSPGARPSAGLVESAISAFRPLEQGAGVLLPAPGPHDPLDAVTSNEEPLAEQLQGFRVLGQLRETYIVAATKDGVAFVDQHVAHERVLYERLTAKQTGQGIPSQRLAVPLTVSFGPAEGALLEHRLQEFSAAGWDIEPFGRHSFAIRAAPALIRQDRYESILRDMVDEIAHQSVARRLIVDRDQVTIAHACRLAVKAGDPLSGEEMTGLLEQLAKTTNPHLCPHGRPAVVVVPYAELDRRFRR